MRVTLVIYQESLHNARSTKHKKRQAMYCTYNVTLRRLLTTIVAVEKQKVLHILSVCF